MKLDPTKEIPATGDEARSAEWNKADPSDGEPNRFQREYTDDGFWDKLSAYARSAGRPVVEKALVLFYTAKSPRTPRWARTTIFGALGYFIVPLDAIPDFIPTVGYSDDLGVIVAAIAVVLAHVTPEIRQKSAEQTARWFGTDSGKSQA